MTDIKGALEERRNELLCIKQEKERELGHAPAGNLRICSKGKRIQYYHRNNPKDTSGVYIREQDINFARQLAQKEYDRKVLSAVQKELHAIEKYLSNYPRLNAEQVYQKLHRARQEMIIPIEETDEQFVYRWENERYQGKDFYEDMPEFYTAKGERVRSKSEVIIADLLNREGVPYRYEFPVYLKDIGMIYPDFTVLNVKTRKEYIWEHFGMMDDMEYAERTVQKIAAYEKNDYFQGENLILTYETGRSPINQKSVMRIVEHYLK